MTGIICLWSGAIVDIPDGWVLCDGNNGTPDLTDKFVMGAGQLFNPGDSDVNPFHTHDFIGDGHYHYLEWDGMIEEGIAHPFYEDFTESENVVGTTDQKISYPPWYALCYIMKL